MDRDRPGARGAPDEGGELLSPGLIHELRQPLMALDARLRLVARDLGDAVKTNESWQLAAGQVARMVEVLETYQRLMTPGAAAAGPFAADVVLRRVVAAHRHRLDALGDGFELVLEPGVPLAHGSPQALHHAVGNLLANALDALEAADRGGRIELRLLARGPAAQVRVADDGPGIARALLPRLFSRRFTTKATGSGLGLAIARRMMRAAGGEVRLVPAGDPARRPWASTELAVDLAAGADAPAPRAAAPAESSRAPRAAMALVAVVAASLAVRLGWGAFQRWIGEPDVVAAAASPTLLPEVVEVVEAAGPVERLRAGAWMAVAAGERLQEDDTVRTAAGGRAIIAVGERSRLTVSGSTQLTVRELTAAVRRLRLARGRISVDHQPDGARVLVVESEKGESVARAGAARFSVLASGATLAVATEAGVVRLQAAGRTVEVAPGQQSVAVPGAAPAPATAVPVQLLLDVARSARLEDGTCGVQGRVDPGSEVLADGVPVAPGPDGRFSGRVPVPKGVTTVTLVTRDAAGRTREQRVRCTRVADPAVVSDFAVRWGQE